MKELTQYSWGREYSQTMCFRETKQRLTKTDIRDLIESTQYEKRLASIKNMGCAVDRKLAYDRFKIQKNLGNFLSLLYVYAKTFLLG